MLTGREYLRTAAVVEHYSQFLKLGLNGAEKQDLVEYLKSL